jgi:hypothetical protein
MGFDMLMLLKIYITGRRYRTSITNVFILFYSCCTFWLFWKAIIRQFQIQRGKSDYLYSPPNIIWVIKSSARWMDRACGAYGRQERHGRFWWRHLREECQLEELGIDGKIILKWIFKKGN